MPAKRRRRTLSGASPAGTPNGVHDARLLRGLFDRLTVLQASLPAEDCLAYRGSRLTDSERPATVDHPAPATDAPPAAGRPLLAKRYPRRTPPRGVTGASLTSSVTAPATAMPQPGSVLDTETYGANDHAE